ncbi:MAG: DUF4845 domain-containing protein [Gammaproteobacteria bacterium]|nr:DUF4845 domain-containing protein [Gammaproteobacteria bacterium]MDH3370522.1 DUF4845 domain-containing protein [Gammaproteobacteria bacterium]MDH3405823.1 DUF4845 domain-containing protein [Gammaproteobacteria bacterium]MDH3561814.1 DUF4845 domain-containing protein [Gammaproteobacteria bacterium]MDH5486543.1 DUF4845 domain-containing protein [Gammaproteobacteria bacterium]
MRIPKHQSGMTMWGMLYVLGTLALFLFILFKLIPPFLDDVKINGALESLGRQPDVGTMPIGEITEALRKRLEIDNIDNFNLANSLTVTARGKTKVVRINYESVTPLLFNASILLTFDHSIEVRGAE